MESSRVEALTINELENIFLHSEYIKPELSKNEKTISWDGFIYLYSDKNKKKENLFGKCNVQVKGTASTSKCMKKSTVSFPIEISDLKNYRHDGGVIYFVGYIINPDKIIFYYKCLLPVDIVKLINKIKKTNQKTISVHLEKLPYKTASIESVIRQFIMNSRYQYSTTSDKPFNLFDF